MNNMNIKKIIIDVLAVLSGNSIAQKILEKIFIMIRLLLGIGSGSYPAVSGEKRVIKELMKIQRNTSESVIIFDVGANEGQFLQLILDNIETEEFNIFSFEPTTEAYQQLFNKYKDFEGINLENIGIDEFNHQSEIYYDEPLSLRASKFKRDLSHLGVEFSNSETVNFVSIDHYCDIHEIARIDLLKIDVEGNELCVLKGCKNLLELHKISIITFEFGRAQIDSRTFFKDIYYFLKNYGMTRLYRILNNGFLKPIDKYDESNEMFFPTNYVAFMD
jgi:FkbM family methyltransferase